MVIKFTMYTVFINAKIAGMSPKNVDRLFGSKTLCKCTVEN